MKRLIAITILLLSVHNSFGQLATYAGFGGTSVAVTGYPNEVVSSLLYSGFGTNTACGSGGLSGITVSTAWSSYSTAGPRVYIKITPNPGYQLNMTGLNAGLRRSGTGPTCVRFAYSLDNGVTWTDDFACHAPINSGCGTTAVSSWSGGALPTGITDVVNGITVALFPYLPSSSAGTFQVNTVNVLGNVTIACTPPPAITGVVPVCAGSSITVSDATSGGTWTSSTTTIATVGTGSGLVTGVSGGTATITYSTGPGCIATAIVTVNPLPSVITGAKGVCIGSTTLLSDATAGGTWTSINTSVATIGSSTGFVTSVALGTSTISYTIATGCAATAIVTVNPLPSAITGTTSVCPGSTAALTDAGGGTWISSNTTVATVGLGTGIVGGVSAGTATITYTLGTGCTTSIGITVNPLPLAITGPMGVCTGLTTILSDATAGGIWTSSNTTVATIGTGSGVVIGFLPGTATISYTIATGCTITAAVTVYPLPLAISGTAVVCAGLTTALSDAGGGTWTSGITTIASVDPVTGLVTGASAGTSTITYTLGTGCIMTRVVTVNPVPLVITGGSFVCVGYTTTLSDATGGGVWSSSNTAVAIIGSGTGVVAGISAGTSVVTYTIGTGCYNTVTVTVNSVPLPITGLLTVCVGSTTSLTDPGVGGTWTSSNTNVATIGLGTGIASGILTGTSTITYTLGSGCITFSAVTVNALPPAISGLNNVCVGSTITLSDAGTGTWSSSNTAVATVGAGTGVVSGISFGTATITFTIPTGCTAMVTITVNPLPLPILGSGYVCIGDTRLLGGSGGGTWSSSNTAIATIGAGTGLVTGILPGTSTITYRLATGCISTMTETVFPLPLAITGSTTVCAGLTTALSDAGGGIWSSGNTSVATVDMTTGVVTGVSAGTSAITYMLATGCTAFTAVSVNALPLSILGTFSVCEGSTTALSDASAGGNWSSSNTAVATVGLSTGIVTGVVAGTTIITYTVSTGCFVATVIAVNASPSAISGAMVVCTGSITSLSDAIAGGTWSANNTAIATVVGGTGIVTGVSAGTTDITYSLGAGCIATGVVTVNPLAPITGVSTICIGFTTALSDILPGGTWTSSATTVATIGVSTGVLTGVSPGTTIITYTFPAGCTITDIITVNPLPPAITGANNVCVGATIILSDAITGGTWTSGTSLLATVGIGSGIVTGISAGLARIIYSFGSGCTVTKNITVNPLPSGIAGSTKICFGTTTTLSDAISGGAWSSGNTSVATIGSGSGIVNGISVGSSSITYTIVTGCKISVPVFIEPLPNIYSVMGGGHYCSGDTGVHVTLNGSAPSTNYFLYNGGAMATGPLSGTGLPLDFGLETIGGAYTVIATNTITGCSSKMSASATVYIDTSVIPSVSISTGVGDTICSGIITTFSATGHNEGSSPVYDWNVNGILVGLGATYAFLPANGDVVTCDLTSNAHCARPATVSNSVKMTVVEPQMPSVTLRPDTVCKGYAAKLTPSSLWGGYTPSYTWYVNASSASVGLTFAFVPSDGDIVYCKMTSNFPCRLANIVASNSVVIKVDSPLIPHVIIKANPGTNIGIGWSDTLKAEVTNGGVSPTYQWVINGIPVIGATTNTYVSSTFNDVKDDSVACEVTSSGLCSMTSYNWTYITVSDVGVKPLVPGSEISVLPNPNKGMFTVKGILSASDEEVTIVLTDMLGQVVYNNSVTAMNGSLNERIIVNNGLADGMYLLSLQSASANKVFHIVIKQ